MGFSNDPFLLRAHAELARNCTVARLAPPTMRSCDLQLLSLPNCQRTAAPPPPPQRGQAVDGCFLELETAPRKEVRRFSPNWPGVGARPGSAATRAQVSSRYNPSAQPQVGRSQ